MRIAFVLLTLVAAVATGCVSVEKLDQQLDRLGSTLEGIAGGIRDVPAALLDSAVFEEVIAKASGRVDNPALVLESFTRTGWRLQFENTEAEFETSGTGTGTILPQGFRGALIERLGQLDPNNPQHVEERERIFEILGWNRRQVEGSGNGG